MTSRWLASSLQATEIFVQVVGERARNNQKGRCEPSHSSPRRRGMPSSPRRATLPRPHPSLLLRETASLRLPRAPQLGWGLHPTSSRPFWTHRLGPSLPMLPHIHSKVIRRCEAANPRPIGLQRCCNIVATGSWLANAVHPRDRHRVKPRRPACPQRPNQRSVLAASPAALRLLPMRLAAAADARASQTSNQRG